MARPDDTAEAEPRRGRRRAPVERVEPAAEPREQVAAVRLVAAAAVVVLALAGSGNLLLLGALLAVVVASRAGTAAVLLASLAVLVRWGGPALASVAGGQAVLGPALVLGSLAAALSTIAAALALTLVAPRALPLAVAVGVVAGAVAAGPELPYDIGVRAAGVVVGVALAIGARRVPFRSSVAVGMAGLALVLAAVA